jgi:hypothetical protein
MAVYKVWFEVFDLSEDKAEALGQLELLIDKLGAVETNVPWENVWWEEVK